MNGDPPEFANLHLRACCPGCRQLEFHCPRCGDQGLLTVLSVPWAGEAICPTCGLSLAITVPGWGSPDSYPETPPLAGDLANLSDALVALERSFNLHPASRGPAEGALTPCPPGTFRLTWAEWITSEGAWAQQQVGQFSRPLPTAAHVAKAYRRLYGSQAPHRKRGAFSYSGQEINRIAEALHQPIETPTT